MYLIHCSTDSPALRPSYIGSRSTRGDRELPGAADAKDDPASDPESGFFEATVLVCEEDGRLRELPFGMPGE